MNIGENSEGPFRRLPGCSRHDSSYAPANSYVCRQPIFSICTGAREG